MMRINTPTVLTKANMRAQRRNLNNPTQEAIPATTSANPIIASIHKELHFSIAFEPGSVDHSDPTSTIGPSRIAASNSDETCAINKPLNQLTWVTRCMTLAHNPNKTSPGSFPPNTILVGSSTICLMAIKKLTLSFPSIIR